MGVKPLENPSEVIFIENNLLTGDFCDFNGKRSLVKKKHNKKYYLYKDHGASKAKTYDHEPMEVIDVVPYGNDEIIFYCDARNNVSFVRSKPHPRLTHSQIADKVEKLPMFLTFAMMIFSSLVFFGVMRFRDYDFKDTQLSLGYKKTCNYRIRFIFPKSIRSKFAMRTGKLSLLVHAYFVLIPLKEIYKHYLESSEINVPMFVKVVNEHGNYYYTFKFRSSSKAGKHHFVYNTRSIRVWGTDVEMYVRKSISGQYVLVVSSILNKLIPLKEKIAYVASRFRRNQEVYDIYFEKFAQGASESGFELFKHAVTQNEKSIYILDKDNPQYNSLKEYYPNNLFAKNSIKAFYHVFLANSFISSDLVTHIQRRLYDNDSLLKKKILENDNKIFLQHGVSLATDLFERGYYNKKVPISPDYIVVNSEYEKRLFTRKSNYEEQDMILTGLPNLDLYVDSRKQKKDEITFLLTWRPWDLTGQVTEGSYIDRYLSFIETIKREPFYQDKKVNVVLHPKAKNILETQFQDIYDKNKESFYDGDIKEALLNSKVLISDYSSVTYMAFAGGTNVVFYWEDKEKAEVEYGAPNILQEYNSFGDIVYDFKNLDKVIQNNYKRPQQSKHIKKYDVMVECTQGNNTLETYKAVSKITGRPVEEVVIHESAQSLA
ncbi:CDP-glycerol glycerophosphotransferase family protein [Fictibacillus sp. S7]|uniref:CDP-glycerol glycerophosphotransferase family protein n=1 Tax=Fictibacillus sp. S7 TaxID=2212476 RepID=UPI001012A9BA|nr:CDP-glycerol glycerophosphotransferase family protein [Fictibacillus sp. S7]RXZ02401.1 CDP-glycerol--glycerophosphate glycerophosphotransferase [Fictibacillus sp. S7]